MDDLFREVHTMCVKLLGGVGPAEAKTTVQNLHCYIETLSPHAIGELGPYLTVPLQNTLRRKDLGETVSILVCTSLQTVFSHSRSEIPEKMLQSLMCTLLGQISDERDADKLFGSESLKLEVISTLFSALQIRSPQALESQSAFSSSAHCVYVLLKILSDEDSLTLRILCLNCIQSLVGLSAKDARSPYEASGVISKRMDAFLPGISLCFGKMIIKNPTLHHSVILEILRTFSHILTAVFSDEEFRIASSKSFDVSTSQEEASIVKTKEWFLEKGPRIAGVIRSMCTCLVPHREFSVRSGLFEMMCRLSRNSFFALEALHPIFVDSISILALDQYPLIRNDIQKLIADLQTDSKKWNTLYTVIQESLYQLTKKLPRVVRNSTCEQSERLLSQLLGYLNLLGYKGFQDYLRSSEHSRRFWMSMCQTVEFEAAKLNLISEVPFISTTDNNNTSAEIPLKYVSTKSVKRVCHWLGEMEDTQGTILSCLNDLYSQSSSLLTEEVRILFLLNAVLEGTLDGKRNQIDIGVIRLISDTYMERLSDIELDKSPSDATVEDLSVDSSTSAILVLLLLEGVGLVARVFQNCDLDVNPLFLGSLYCVLKFSDSSLAVVRDRSLITLANFAQTSGAKDVANLLERNMDFLTYSLSIKLRRLHLFPRVPLVVGAILRNSAGSTLICDQMSDLLRDILSAVDEFHSQRSVLLLKALLEYVKALTAYPPTPPHPPQQDTLLPEQEAPDSESDEECEVDEKKPPPSPPHVQLTVEILSRTKHLLSSHHLPLRMILLDLIRHSLNVLSQYEDDLLPMIHQNWLGVLARFSDSEKPIALKSFQVIETMGAVSGDFVTRRIRDELFPKVFKFLSQSLQKSSESGVVFCKSATFNLQHHILTNISVLCGHIRLDDVQTVSLLKDTLNSYLKDPTQPLQLKDAARNSLQSLQHNPVVHSK